MDTASGEGTQVNHTTWGFGYEGVWPGQFAPKDLYNVTFGTTVSVPYWQDGRHHMHPSGLIQVDWITLGKPSLSGPAASANGSRNI
jgi:hypothetical protein